MYRTLFFMDIPHYNLHFSQDIQAYGPTPLLGYLGVQTNPHFWISMPEDLFSFQDI
jgi:hypothetical protein